MKNVCVLLLVLLGLACSEFVNEQECALGQAYTYSYPLSGDSREAIVQSDLPLHIVPNSVSLTSDPDTEFLRFLIKTNCPQDETIVQAADNVTVALTGNCATGSCSVNITGENVTPGVMGPEQCQTVWNSPTESLGSPSTWMRGSFALTGGVAFLVLSFFNGFRAGTSMLLLAAVIGLTAWTASDAPQAIAQPSGECSLWVDVLVSLKNCRTHEATFTAPNLDTPLSLYNPCVVEGRPYRTQEGYMLASTEHKETDWMAPLHPLTEGLDVEALQQRWIRAGLAEQASVASFSMFSLHLLAVGAPAGLVQRAHQSALDEVRHAQMAFGLAAAYGGAPVSPGQYPAHSVSIRPDIMELCLDTAREGCVVETVSTLQAAAELEAETDPVVQKVLEAIVMDESQHSVLAWHTVKWCAQQPGTDSMLTQLNATITDALEQHASHLPLEQELIQSLVKTILFKEDIKPSLSGPNPRANAVSASIFKLAHK